MLHRLSQTSKESGASKLYSIERDSKFPRAQAKSMGDPAYLRQESDSPEDRSLTE